MRPRGYVELGDAIAVVARDDDRVAVGVDATDHADVAAVRAPAHDRNRADLGPGNALAIRRE